MAPYPDKCEGFLKRPALLSSRNNTQSDGFAATAAAASLAEFSRPTAMKEWIAGAIHSLREKKNNSLAGSSVQNKILCSRDYLSCALIIAYSLADQLSAIEEQRVYEGGEAKDTLTQQQPHYSHSNKSWSSCIYINCGARTNGEKNDTSIINIGLGDDNIAPEYLNITGAALRDDVVEGVSLNYDGKREIYSLGVVFYELFSGGQIKVDDANMLLESPATRRKSLPTDHLVTATRREELTSTWASSIPVDNDATYKQGFGSTLELIDAIGEDDKFFGSACNIDDKNEDSLKNISDIDQQSDQQGYPRPTRRKSDSYARGGQLQKTFRTASPESISVEPLRSLPLPTALCDLISNMIETSNNCDNDCGVDDETYKSMTDVRDDLKILMDSPNLYLRDIDIIHASKVGLHFECTGDPLYGREAELETLKESYHRSISSECEVAIICGVSGIGKSMLSNKFAEYVTARSGNGGGILLSGRFDKLQQAQPFHAISSAFDNYCSWLSLRDRMMVEKVSSALKEDIGEEVSSLVTVMPNLASIFGNNFDCGKTAENDDSAVDAQKRMRYTFCQFVEVLSRCHEEPLILFLDDCQWIDAASVALLKQILIMMSGASIIGHSFFFYCCCRDDEMNETHPLSLMLSSVGNFGTKTTKILLTSMSKDTVNKMVSTTLSLLPRLTRPLANILHHKTKGSPFFIKQLMVELNKQRMLYPSLKRRRWVWESDKIRDMEIPENIAIFITKSLDRLPSEVLSALCVLSCFGASADISVVQRLETEIMQPLIEQLETAFSASVLGKRNGEFYFLHDKLQEAAYSMMIPEEVRCLQHFRFGLALGDVAVREKDDKLLITAVSQINHGGPQAVIDSEQGVAVAKMNLDAGKKAMKMSDFFSAYSFFDSGISYLRKKHWVEHYDLTLELFNLAARCAFMNAEYVSLKILTGQIMRKAKCFEDKCQAISISITLLLWSGNVHEATKVIFDMLKNLGEELPCLITPAVIQHHLVKTKSKLSGLADDSLLSYPLMVNPSKKIAMDVLPNLFEAFSVTGEKASLPIIPLKMIQISLKYGMTTLSPLGFAQYGNYLALVRGEFEEGYRYVKFALYLMKQMPSRVHDCDIIYDSNHTKLVVEPMQSAVENYLEAFKAAMINGATRNAMKCSFMYDIESFWSGKKLDAIVGSMKKTMKRMRYHKNVLMLEIILPLFRVALRLTGQTDTSQQSHLTDVFGETRKEGDIAGKLTTLMLTVSFNGCYEALMFREFDKALDSAEKFFEEQSQSTLTMSAPLFHRSLYFGLVSFWISREMNNKQSKKWIARGVECKDAIEKLAISASTWNFQNKTYLLQAEEQFSLRNYEEAERLYDAAILSSKEHKFVNEEALANEFAGHFHVETGRRNRSLPYFSQAIEKYSEWGAAAKASKLAKYLNDMD